MHTRQGTFAHKCAKTKRGFFDGHNKYAGARESGNVKNDFETTQNKRFFNAKQQKQSRKWGVQKHISEAVRK
jgi:hypothetical protein